MRARFYDCSGKEGGCGRETCKQCCEHEFDWDEGYTCLNCGEQGDIGALIDANEGDMER